MNNWRIMARDKAGRSVLIVMGESRGDCFLLLPMALSGHLRSEVRAFEAFFLERWWKRPSNPAGGWMSIKEMSADAVLKVVEEAEPHEEEDSAYESDELDEVERRVHQTMLEAVGIE